MRRIDEPADKAAEAQVEKQPWSEPVLRFWGNFSALVQAHAKSGGRSDGGGFKRGVG